jgi:pleiotropic regulator 1
MTSTHALLTRSFEHTQALFRPVPGGDDEVPAFVAGRDRHRAAKVQGEYALVADALPPAVPPSSKQTRAASKRKAVEAVSTELGPVAAKRTAAEGTSLSAPSTAAAPSLAVALRRPDRQARAEPAWHPQWKLKRVISGHLGWVRSIAVEPGNQWFATGAADRTIKVWDLASGVLKLTLTGHINTVRGLAISPRHPYLFSAGEDKTVKCWDLETNQVVRHYHGHMSGVYSVALHPTLDVLVTGSRDSSARVWDMRTKKEIHILGGHDGAVSSIVCQAADPQVLTGSMDSTVRLWDLAAGKTMATLTNHKKGVRALVAHPTEFTFASGSADAMKKWQCSGGQFLDNFDTGSKDNIVNCLAINADDVMVSGHDDGQLRFWDWSSGCCFQSMRTINQPGSLDGEAAIFASTFDHSGSRLITCEGDKTIKVWQEDANSTPETHPVVWDPDQLRERY